MKNFLKSIVVALIVLATQAVYAHQADVSAFTLVEQKPGHWILQINAAMTAFQYEVKNAFGEDSYATPEEFNLQLLSHLKKHIIVEVNGEAVTLAMGSVQLGHETTVAFELSGVPENVEEVFVKNTGFENIHHSQVVFGIIKEGLDRSRFTLSEANEYQLNVALTENQVVLAAKSEKDAWIELGAVIGIIGFVAFGLFKINQGKEALDIKSLTKA